ncbi:hypothetical protein D7231_31930 [Streptomyces klenkii]|uniref:Uncharacterized protein n=1 Tax=Streptomyces klenkii TaxID=1420899 RepID=A0A3B0ANN2_9ACTN|nr:hypothetical protein [Streptomyces klenkii]RKN61884.1 hypothetical protein D7231_31930 [Streptomyces klenkii]
MSYDISLWMKVDTGGPEPVEIELADIGNYTSNVGRMWVDALGHRLADLKDRTARDCIDALTRAVAAMESDPAKYEAMNPPNGWGDYDGALNYLRRLRDACLAHPNATVHISH